MSARRARGGARVLLRGALLVVGAALPTGCYASNVVAPDARAVEAARPRVAWRPATARDLPGFWASTEVTGALAGGVLKAYAWFDAEGGYSSAALVVGEEGPRFAVLSEGGRWAFGPDGVDLHDGAGPLQAFAAPGRLRLDAPDGAIAFEAVALE